MTALWVRLRTDVHRNGKVAGLSSDSARWAYVVALAEAKATEGVFPSMATCRVALGLWARHVRELLRAGLLELEEDTGVVLVHDWDEHQSVTDPTAAARMRRYRERQRNGGGGAPGRNAEPVTQRNAEPVTGSGAPPPARAREMKNVEIERASASPRSPRAPGSMPFEPLREGLPALTAEAVQELEGLTGMLATQASHKVMGDLDLLAGRHGMGQVLEAARAARGTYNGVPPSWPQLVYGARNALEPLPSGRRQEAGQQSATAALEERRKARGQIRQMAYLRGEITEAQHARLRELDLLPGEEPAQ